MQNTLYIVMALAMLPGCNFDGDVEASAPANSFFVLPSGRVSQSALVVGNGGDPFGPIYCPAGYVLIGLDGDFYSAADLGAGFCEVQAVCARLELDGEEVRRSETQLVPEGTFLGDCGTNRVPIEPAICPAPQVVVGFAARQGGMFGALTQLELRCGAIDSEGAIFSRNFEDVWGQTVGSTGSRQFSDCVPPAVAVGIFGEVGVVIDGMGLLCQSLAPSP